MIRITVYATDDIDDVSALAVENILKDKGVHATGTRVARISQKQYDIGMKRHRG